MRVRGVQVRGLRSLEGGHPLKFEPGYNVVVCPERHQARALASLLVGMLYPRTLLPRLDVWQQPERAGARAVASVVLGAEDYRVVVDLAQHRLVLARQEADPGGYTRVADDPAGAEALLGADAPAAEDFLELGTCGLGRAFRLARVRDDGAGEPAASPPEDKASRERAFLEAELNLALRALEQRETAEARAETLRSARDELELAELASGQAQDLLVDAPGVPDSEEELERDIEHFHVLVEQRDRARAAIVEDRRALHADRTRLRATPGRQVVPLVGGVLTGGVGAAGAALGFVAGYPMAMLGVLIGCVSLLITAAARRRVGTLDARLAALRVGERKVEREFESEAERVRGLLLAFGLDSADELRSRVAENRELASRSSRIGGRVPAARERFPAEAEVELERLEAELARSDPKDEVARLRHALGELPEPRVESPAPAEGPTPDGLVAVGARLLGIDEEELRSRLAPTLALYLRPLTSGAYTLARWQKREGWMLRGEASGPPRRWAEVEEVSREPLVLAFRLALIEVIAARRKLVLVVGPELDDLEACDPDVIAHALARVSASAQVLQFNTAARPWRERGATVSTL